jgi:hypothetical protein
MPDHSCPSRLCRAADDAMRNMKKCESFLNEAAIKKLIGCLMPQVNSFLRNLKIYFAVPKSPLLDPIRSQVNAVHA